MKSNILKATLFTAFALYLGTFFSMAYMHPKDQQLNQLIEDYVPVYCSVKRNYLEYWPHKYIFIWELINPAPGAINPKPMVEHNFLGYAQKSTKVRLVCRKIDSACERKTLKEEAVALFELQPGQKSLVYRSPKDSSFRPVKIEFSLRRTMLPITVESSRERWKWTKTYKKARVYYIDATIEEKKNV